LTAPLSGRRCVYYAVVVSHHQGRQWNTVVNERRGTSFAVADGTGRAIIDPANAELALCFDESERTDWLDRPTPAQEKILARHGITSTGWLFPKTLRFEEAVVEVGDVVSVIGAGIREPDLASQRETDYRSNAAMQLRMTSSAAAPLSLRAELVR
jgi:E3 ubiquitin ligase